MLIMNSLEYPGVNRMAGIIHMMDYFKRQTIKMKGDILVFDSK